MKNPYGKTRDKENPYAIYQIGEWTWRVLKTYKLPKNESGDQYARWFCFVTSPFCPYGEYGDVYRREIVGIARCVKPFEAEG